MIPRGHIDLAPDHRTDARLDRGAVELEGSKYIAVVGDRDRRHPQPRNLFRKLGYPDRGVKQRVVAMQVKMDKWRRLGRSAHGAIIPRLALRRAPSPGIPGTHGRWADCGRYSWLYSRQNPSSIWDKISEFLRSEPDPESYSTRVQKPLRSLMSERSPIHNPKENQ